jgi:hypothetical protein
MLQAQARGEQFEPKVLILRGALSQAMTMAMAMLMAM